MNGALLVLAHFRRLQISPKREVNHAMLGALNESFDISRERVGLLFDMETSNLNL